MSAQIKEIKYATYCNDKYDYCIDFPSDILFPLGESGSGDGQVFESKNKQNTLTVYRDFRDNIDPDVKFKIATAYQEDIVPINKNGIKKTVTYKKIGKDFYVVSGYKNDKIYYQKTLLKDGQLRTCKLVYQVSEKQLYNALSEHVFKSF